MKDQREKQKGRKKHPDISSRWVKIYEPASDSLSRKLQEENFNRNCGENGEPFYKDFFAHNNFISKSAKHLGIKSLGKNYDEFFEEGLRVSQQLDGKFREIHMNNYYEKLQEIFSELFGQLPARGEASAKKKRKEQLEIILKECSSLPEKERKLIDNIYDELIQEDVIINPPNIEIRTLALKLKDSAWHERDDILGRLESYVYSVKYSLRRYEEKLKSLSENIGKVEDVFKPKFINLVTCPYAFGENPFENDENKIIENLRRLDNTKAGIYLDFLDKMAKNTPEDDIYRELKEWIEIAKADEWMGPAQHEIYMKSLERTMQEGIYNNPERILLRKLQLYP